LERKYPTKEESRVCWKKAKRKGYSGERRDGVGDFRSKAAFLALRRHSINGGKNPS